MNKKIGTKIIKSVIVLAVALFLHNWLYSAFQMYNWGGRPAGMGFAFVGIADDSNCMNYNPAGLSLIKKQELQFLYAKPFMGVENVEIGFLSLKYTGAVKGVGKIGLIIDQFDAGSGLYKEFIYGVGIGDRVYKMSDGTEIFAGGKVKYMGHSYSYDESLLSYSEVYGDSVVSKGRSKTGITLDLGLVAKKDFLTVGLAVENLTQPDLGIAYEDKVPMLIRVGGSYFIPKQNILVSVEIDLRQQTYGENNMSYGLGGEYMVKENIILRAGYSTKGITVGGSIITKMQQKNLLGLDAAYILNSGELSGSDLQVSVKYQW
jgi:hypothetical protein